MRAARGEALNFIGLPFGRLTVVGESARVNRQARWVCQCICGNRRTVYQSTLTSGSTRSCGCLGAEVHGALMTTHGHAVHGKESPEFNSWRSMIERCRNVKNNRYARYGGRGISVCERWRDDFTAFLADMGRRPAGHTLDRISSDGNYEPGNCRWATPAMQQRNRSFCKVTEQMAARIRQLIRDGARNCDIAEEHGIRPSIVSDIKHGRTWAQ